MAIEWQEVGEWVKNNAGNGAALVGSLITGNVPAAVAAGVSMVSSATGTNDPTEALNQLKTERGNIEVLEKIALDNKISIRKHIEVIERIKLEEHRESQKTIRNGDNAEGLVKYVRPLQSTLALLYTFYYLTFVETASFEFAGLLMSLPLAYHGLRQIGKWKESKQSPN